MEGVSFSSFKQEIPLEVEQAVEPVIEGEHRLEKGQKSITQTSEESVSYVCINVPPSESHSDRHVRAFVEQNFEAAQNDRKSVCSSLLKRICLAPGILAILLIVVGILAFVIYMRGKISDIRI